MRDIGHLNSYALLLNPYTSTPTPYSYALSSPQSSETSRPPSHRSRSHPSPPSAKPFLTTSNLVLSCLFSFLTYLCPSKRLHCGLDDKLLDLTSCLLFFVPKLILKSEDEKR